MLYVSANNTQATLNPYNFFNNTLANLSAPADFQLLNVSEANKTSWGSQATFKN